MSIMYGWEELDFPVQKEISPYWLRNWIWSSCGDSVVEVTGTPGGLIEVVPDSLVEGTTDIIPKGVPLPRLLKNLGQSYLWSS